jgi:L-arabinose isomerase
MRRPRLGLIVPFVSFYEPIIALRREKEAFAARLGQTLRQICDLTDAGLVESEADACQAGEQFARAEVDGVVVAPALAVFGALPWAALRDLPRHLPVAIWHHAPLRTVPPDYDIRALIRSSGGLGVMALANTLAREGRVFRVFCSHNEEGVPAPLLRFAAGARAAALVRRARLALVGTVFPQMIDVQMDAANWALVTGADVIAITASEFAAVCQSVSESELEAAVREVRARHAVGDISDDELRRSMRLAVALDRLVEERRLSGGAFNCHGENCLQNPALGVTGCYAVTKQTSAGRPFSCTGDLPTAVALILAKQLAGVAIYGEMDLVDEERDCVLLANGGEGDAALSAEPMQIFGNENFTGMNGRGASVSVIVPQASATLLSFTPMSRNRYRLVVAEGAFDPHIKTALKGFHAGFRFAGKSAHRGFQDWCEAGATHHLAATTGWWADTLRLVCELFGWEAHIIAEHEEA